jgi:anti-sigma B factor antagonist
MLNISKVKNADQLSVALEGTLDRNSAPLLDEELKASLDGVNKLIFDFKNLEYISSAGLRVILIAKKQLNSDNAVVIKGASREIKEVFDVTGFSKILTISWL